MPFSAPPSTPVPLKKAEGVQGLGICISTDMPDDPNGGVYTGTRPAKHRIIHLLSFGEQDSF